ncbi:MAG: hypothetical protein ABL917_02330 [Parcubacteria group bacterium]
MIINRKSTFFLGIFIFLIPFLGLPTLWKTIFTLLAGAFLVSLSVTVSLVRRGSKYNKLKKERVTPVFVENLPPKVAEEVLPVIVEFEPKVEQKVEQKPKPKSRPSPRIRKASAILTGIEK